MVFFHLKDGRPAVAVEAVSVPLGCEICLQHSIGVMASNLKAMASKLIAMASKLEAMASNPMAMASNLIAKGT